MTTNNTKYTNMVLQDSKLYQSSEDKENFLESLSFSISLAEEYYSYDNLSEINFDKKKWNKLLNILYILECSYYKEALFAMKYKNIECERIFRDDYKEINIPKDKTNFESFLKYNFSRIPSLLLKNKKSDRNFHNFHNFDNFDNFENFKRLDVLFDNEKFNIIEGFLRMNFFENTIKRDDAKDIINSMIEKIIKDEDDRKILQLFETLLNLVGDIDDKSYMEFIYQAILNDNRTIFEFLLNYRDMEKHFTNIFNSVLNMDGLKCANYFLPFYKLKNTEEELENITSCSYFMFKMIKSYNDIDYEKLFPLVCDEQNENLIGYLVSLGYRDELFSNNVFNIEGVFDDPHGSNFWLEYYSNIKNLTEKDFKEFLLLFQDSEYLSLKEVNEDEFDQIVDMIVAVFKRTEKSKITNKLLANIGKVLDIKYEDEVKKRLFGTA